MNKKHYLIPFLFLMASTGYSKILVTPNYPSLKTITLTGSISEADIGSSTYFGRAISSTISAGSQYLFLNYKFEDGSKKTFIDYRNNNSVRLCPEALIPEEDFLPKNNSLTEKGRLKAINAVNQQLSGGLQMNTVEFPNPNNLIVVEPSITYTLPEGVSIFYCNPPAGSTYGMYIPVNNVSFLPVSPDPSIPSTCSLNSQNLELKFTSGQLDVEGLSQSTNLIITCSSGDGKNYNLRLTGNNVINGRLNFGNGVSAKVSLNGIEVQANGSGITLNNLTSRTISVRASLVGSAFSSGITNTSGILVLDAL